MHLVKVPVSTELIKELMIDGAEVRVRCTHGIPDTAIIRSVTSDCRDGATRIVFFVEHESFADIPEWREIPMLVPQYESIIGGA